MWRWDQGRLAYFSLENIRRIAGTLQQLNGIDLRQEPDPLRLVLQSETGLPFAPNHYKIWRNYARVFKVLGLASKLNNRLVTTQICERLLRTGQQFYPYDDYLQHIARTFYYPSPVFQGYNAHKQQIFPFCAILRLLIAKLQFGAMPFTDLEEVFSCLIGNGVTGQEPIPQFNTFPKKKARPRGDHGRQVREMIIFLSQLSYLSWIDGKLFLDPLALKNLSFKEIDELSKPIVRARVEDPEEEIQAISSVTAEPGVEVDLREPTSVDDILFTEGKKIRVSHLRTERNRKIVGYYFENCANEYLCDVCEVEVKDRYPWINNLIEVHHILPLSSPLHVTSEGTSISDLVGLCPNCHRATHAYYRKYLASRRQDDFFNREEARLAYTQVKESFLNI